MQSHTPNFRIPEQIYNYINNPLPNSCQCPQTNYKSIAGISIQNPEQCGLNSIPIETCGGTTSNRIQNVPRKTIVIDTRKLQEAIAKIDPNLVQKVLSRLKYEVKKSGGIVTQSLVQKVINSTLNEAKQQNINNQPIMNCPNLGNNLVNTGTPEVLPTTIYLDPNLIQKVLTTTVREIREPTVFSDPNIGQIIQNEPITDTADTNQGIPIAPVNKDGYSNMVPNSKLEQNVVNSAPINYLDPPLISTPETTEEPVFDTQSIVANSMGPSNIPTAEISQSNLGLKPNIMQKAMKAVNKVRELMDSNRGPNIYDLSKIENRHPMLYRKPNINPLVGHTGQIPYAISHESNKPTIINNYYILPADYFNNTFKNSEYFDRRGYNRLKGKRRRNENNHGKNIQITNSNKRRVKDPQKEYCNEEKEVNEIQESESDESYNEFCSTNENLLEKSDNINNKLEMNANDEKIINDITERFPGIPKEVTRKLLTYLRRRLKRRQSSQKELLPLIDNETLNRRDPYFGPRHTYHDIEENTRQNMGISEPFYQYHNHAPYYHPYFYYNEIPPRAFYSRKKWHNRSKNRTTNNNEYIGQRPSSTKEDSTEVIQKTEIKDNAKLPEIVTPNIEVINTEKLKSNNTDNKIITSTTTAKPAAKAYKEELPFINDKNYTYVQELGSEDIVPSLNGYGINDEYTEAPDYRAKSKQSTELPITTTERKIEYTTIHNLKTENKTNDINTITTVNPMEDSIENDLFYQEILEHTTKAANNPDDEENLVFRTPPGLDAIDFQTKQISKPFYYKTAEDFDNFWNDNEFNRPVFKTEDERKDDNNEVYDKPTRRAENRRSKDDRTKIPQKEEFREIETVHAHSKVAKFSPPLKYLDENDQLSSTTVNVYLHKKMEAENQYKEGDKTFVFARSIPYDY